MMEKVFEGWMGRRKTYIDDALDCTNDEVDQCLECAHNSADDGGDGAVDDLEEGLD